MTKPIEQLINDWKSLPAAEQDTAAEIIFNLLEHRRAPIPLDDDTLAAIDEGLAQADRGEVLSQEEMAAFYRRLGI